MVLSLVKRIQIIFIKKNQKYVLFNDEIISNESKKDQ